MKIAAYILLLVILSGCSIFTDILNGLSNAASQPKVIWSETTQIPGEPRIVISALQPNDRAFVFRTITDFGAPGSINRLSLSPEENYIGISHVEEGTVIERI